jgi:hypothetical protein
MIYVNSKVLEFWVMEITSIYDFLHLLNLIKNRPNMDWGGGGFGICTYMPQYYYFFPFKESGERLTNKTEVRCKKHIMAFILFYFQLIFLIWV